MAPGWIGIDSTGAFFFAEVSSWSFLAIAALYLIGSRLALAISLIELISIIIILMCAWQEVTSPGWLLNYYDAIITWMANAEVVLLVIGAPWRGIHRLVHEYWRAPPDPVPTMGRAALGHQMGKAACQRQ